MLHSPGSEGTGPSKGQRLQQSHQTCRQRHGHDQRRAILLLLHCHDGSHISSNSFDPHIGFCVDVFQVLDEMLDVDLSLLGIDALEIDDDFNVEAESP